MSVYSEEEFAIRSFKLGASGYLSKNRASNELLAAAKKILTGGKYVTTSLAEKLASMLGSDVQHALHDSLSSRELQVLRMIANGRTSKEVAAELALSEKTVGTYRKSHFKKNGFDDQCRVDALRHAASSRGLGPASWFAVSGCREYFPQTFSIQPYTKRRVFIDWHNQGPRQ